MKDRKPNPINAGSMADIAFLLLIFFIVTTTIATEEGITQTLPKFEEPDSIPPGGTAEKEILEIKINALGELLVEGKTAYISELQTLVLDFYTNTSNPTEYPKRTRISSALCEREIEAATQSGQFKRAKIWKQKLSAIKTLGSFDELPKACIMIDSDRKVSYNEYIKVQNALNASINEMKDKLCKEKFQKSYFDLDYRFNKKDKSIYDALTVCYPLRLVEPYELAQL